MVVVGGWTKTKLILFSTQVEVVVEIGVEFGVEVEACHYYSGLTKTKLMLF